MMIEGASARVEAPLLVIRAGQKTSTNLDNENHMIYTILADKSVFRRLNSIVDYRKQLGYFVRFNLKGMI